MHLICILLATKIGAPQYFEILLSYKLAAYQLTTNYPKLLDAFYTINFTYV